MSFSSSSLPHHQRGIALFGIIFLLTLIAAGIALAVYTMHLDKIVREKFEGQRWEIPAKVYARPLELFVGAELTPEELKSELGMLNYRKMQNYEQSGTWMVNGNTWFIHTRGFDFDNGQEPEQVLKIEFQGNQIFDIQSTIQTGTGMVRLEPIVIGGIYPRHNEDRVLVQLAQVPQPLIDALISTEDRQFYQHNGISVRGTARALVSTATGGERQGGSTLTQQLVKNFYLTSERTLKRKANEALMAVLLELHYSKNDLLETYLNEINLGQNGNRAIHGFGLAAQFYFNQPLRELKLHQIALLVGIVKGPSQYNPWRNPKLALERRNVVLHNMLLMGKISQADYDMAKEKPLTIVKKPIAGKSLFPDFLDVVRRQLAQQYQESDLSSGGLQIFSTLDPRVQTAASKAFDQSISRLSQRNPKQLNGLQGAVVISNPQNGELVAVVGGSGTFTGFNRALDAHRQIGSLVKPAIYLNALQSKRYHLLSPIDDSPISITGMGMTDWTPKNYDHRDHGTISLSDALAHSYNQSTVRLGWELGIPSISSTLRQLGIDGDIPQYPSLLLGAINLSPIQVLNMYQTYAANGFGYPLTAIRSVLDAKNQPLQRYGFNVKQRIDSGSAYLINHALQQVVNTGTATAINTNLPNTLKLAGKTGTTNDARDAWFAGYSGNYTTVVWLGHDDNRPIGLSGATGALPVWIDVMRRLKLTPVEPQQPSDIQWQWIDQARGQISAQGCTGAVFIPMLIDSLPKEFTACAYQYYQNQNTASYTDETGTYAVPDDPMPAEEGNYLRPSDPDMSESSRGIWEGGTFE
jgi:penicillin-binding protein 1B